MNTNSALALIPPRRARDYVFILDELEFAFPKEQLNLITKHWNSGMELEDIAKRHKRKPEEVLLALIHQARRNEIERPFAYRRK